MPVPSFASINFCKNGDSSTSFIKNQEQNLHSKKKEKMRKKEMRSKKEKIASIATNS